MIQDIAPKKYHCEYQAFTPTTHDFVLLFDGEKILLEGNEHEGFSIPRYDALPSFLLDDSALAQSSHYLFSIDDDRFFLYSPEDTLQAAEDLQAALPQEFSWREVFFFRQMALGWMSFVGLTAHHLYLWYQSNRFCGRCGAQTVHDTRERMLACPDCKATIYPKISPVVIVAVTDGNRLLLTRPNGARYKHYALVAGFVEIGETFEDAVRREVFEETGIKVCNIRYYKSQPWGLSSSLLAGYYCDLEGSATITRQESELAEALWLEREDIPQTPDTLALTTEMIEAFRTNSL